MAKWIVGLGNPGSSYAKTRHNVGFMCVDAIRDTLGLDREKPKEKWQASVVETMLYGQKVYLMCPLTYMNNSGEAVREALSYGNGDAKNDLIVIYDDLDLPTGKIRLRTSGGSGGHNGIKSITAHLGTDEYARIRIGIGRPPFDVTVVDHVLTAFTKQERPIIDDAVNQASDAIVLALRESFTIAMNRFNLKN